MNTLHDASFWIEFSRLRLRDHIRFGSKADVCSALGCVCFGPKADTNATPHHTELKLFSLNSYDTAKPSGNDNSQPSSDKR
jgi:hypothetical protein